MLDLPEIFSLMRRLAIESGYLSDPLSKLDEALKIIQEEIPLPAVYAWLSLYPYELNGKHKEADKLIIEKLQCFVASRKAKKPTITTETQREKIAIVGSGPAGLTAAYELTKRGYSVTVFESLPFPGGMLRVGIPDYRLSREALEADLGYIMDLGVRIRTNVMVGKDVTIDGLSKEGYGAIFTASGAHKSVNIDIEGKELGGVFEALDFFRKLHMGERMEIGQKVAVIGGGNVAMDAARTALRLGAKEVNVLYRRSRVEMPASPSEVRDAEMEGAKIHFLVTPTKILGNDKRVVGVKCTYMQLGEPDETGRRRPIPVEGSDYTPDVDTIILAIGETSDLSFLPKDVVVTGRNTIAVDPATMETSSPGIFAGGDVVSGPASVVDALVAGKRAADSIDRQLRGETKVG
jgi:NADPH-dependent glutamate synthase beta subunit-like oxidoreductase